MKNAVETITIPKSEYDELKVKADKNKSLESDVAELTAKVEWLMEQFRLARRRRKESRT
jgi:FtsZ-binding cell division protein ZapB